MAIDLNAAPDEGEDHEPLLNEELQAGRQFVVEEELQAGHHIDLNMNPEDEREAAMHEEEPHAGHHFDLNINPIIEDEHEAYVHHGEDDLHESDESDNELEDQAGVFQTMEEELQAMDDALEDLHVDHNDYGVYAGDVEVEFEEEELDDSESEDIDAQQEQADNEQVHDEDKYKIMSKFMMKPTEEDPHRTVQNKNSIGKVMFLVLIARPRYNAEGVCIFDGKIGIWPFIEKEQEYGAYGDDKINRVFLTLQNCLIEVMKKGGGNGYKIPHMYKDGLERTGNLPNVLGCDRELYESVVQTLAD